MQARGAAGPVAVAVIAVLTVVVAVLVARPDGSPAPYPPLPVDPSPPDRTALSLDRCAAALELADLDGRYPPRVRWDPVARLADDLGAVTVLDGRVPFVCVTGPTTVEVSDPAAAVPAGGATVLLTGAVLAALAPAGGTVAVPAGPAAAVLLHRGEVASLVVGGATVPLERPAPPALSVTDRREIPADRSAESVTLLQRCQGVEPPDRFWLPAVVLERDGTALLVATGSAAVGGCVVEPGRAAPVRLWRVGGPVDGPRPFVWLADPPGTSPGTAAGPVQPRVTRMEVTAPTGGSWPAAVGNRAFAIRLPPGVDPDPRTLTVRAYDASGVLLYEGPAAS